MATKTYYYPSAGFASGTFRVLSETAQTAQTNVEGWVVGTGATNSAPYSCFAEVGTANFVNLAQPDGVLVGGANANQQDALQTPVLNGTFAAGNWTFNFVVRAVTSAGGQNGRIRLRVHKGNADGTSITEITSGQQQCSLVGTMSSTTTDYTSSLTLSLPAITLSNEYLFFELAWERTVAGSMSSSDVNWRTGSSASAGTRIATTDFVAAQAVAGTTIDRTVLVDELATSFRDGAVNQGDGGQAAQSFVGNGQELATLTFYVARTTAGDTGTLQAYVYATTGTHGTDALPTGSPLATSANTVNVTTLGLSPTFTVVTFTFADPLPLTAGTTFAAALGYAGPNNPAFGYDTTSPAHAGNGSSFVGSWGLTPTRDLIFSVYARPSQGFAPSISQGAAGLAVTTAFLASTAALTAPTVVPGAVTITATTIAAGSVVRVPTVTQAGGDQAVTGATIAASSLATAPTLAYAVSLATVASTAILTAPTVTPTVLPATITSSAQLFAPTVTPPATTVTTATITSTTTLTAPTVAPGAVTITTATITATTQLFAPSLGATGAVTLPTIASSTQLFAPTIAPGIVTVVTPFFAATTTLFAPAVAGGVTPPPSGIADLGVVRIGDTLPALVSIGGSW